MRWTNEKKLPKKNRKGDVEVRYPFAWLPEQMSDGKTTVWFETYIQTWKLEWTETNYIKALGRFTDAGPGLTWNLVKKEVYDD